MFSHRVCYRTLQYLGILQNEILQRVLLTSVIFSSIFTQSCTCALLVSTYNSITNWFELALVTVTVVNTFPILLVLLGNLASVYVISKKCLQTQNKEMLCTFTGNMSKIRAERKYLRSCQCIKVGFGDLNFVDQTTPLNCIDFTNNLTVQILLLQNKL